MSRDIDKRGILSRDIHPLGTFRSVAHQHGQGLGMPVVSQTRPADAIPMIEVVDLRPVGIVAARVQELVNHETM